MNNPRGPYPGRQLFLGLTTDKRPALAYLVTGRSKESRERKAVQVDSTIRMGPLGDIAYDPLRHYTAVKYDNQSGIIAVSNGIQTETIYEIYKLLYNVGSPLTKDFMARIMEGANAEPDSYHTPRIAGVVVDGPNPTLIIGVKNFWQPAIANQLIPRPGTLTGISTYEGSMDNPVATNPTAALPDLKFEGKTPGELAKFIYEISQAEYKGDDIRVCGIGIMRSADNKNWEISIINAH
jgi:IMP cyclohydrolase